MKKLYAWCFLGGIAGGLFVRHFWFLAAFGFLALAACEIIDEIIDDIFQS